MYQYSFEKLEVWQLVRQLRKEIYVLTRQFPDHEKFGLISQIRRSTSSIGDCIAEGSGKLTPKDKAHFTNMAYASALETVNHIIGSRDLEYITEKQYIEFRQKIEQITRMLAALRTAQLNGKT